jgi:hypothetical protein
MPAKSKAQRVIEGDFRLDWVHPRDVDSILDEMCEILGFNPKEKLCSFRFSMDMDF